MINLHTLHNILNNLQNIQNLCSEKGFNHPFILKPCLSEHKDVIHLLVETSNNTDMFDKLRTAKKIQDIVGCKVEILTKEAIPSILDEMLNEPISLNNIQSIIYGFLNYLIPFSKDAENFNVQNLENNRYSQLCSEIPKVINSLSPDEQQEAKKILMMLISEPLLQQSAQEEHLQPTTVMSH